MNLRLRNFVAALLLTGAVAFSRGTKTNPFGLCGPRAAGIIYHEPVAGFCEGWMLLSSGVRLKTITQWSAAKQRAGNVV